MAKKADEAVDPNSNPRLLKQKKKQTTTTKTTSTTTSSSSLSSTSPTSITPSAGPSSATVSSGVSPVVSGVVYDASRVVPDGPLSSWHSVDPGLDFDDNVPYYDDDYYATLDTEDMPDDVASASLGPAPALSASDSLAPARTS